MVAPQRTLERWSDDVAWRSWRSSGPAALASPRSPRSGIERGTTRILMAINSPVLKE